MHQALESEEPGANFKGGQRFACVLCEKPAGEQMRCSRCKAVWYCSTACQKQHWKLGHKQVCSPPVAEPKATRRPATASGSAPPQPASAATPARPPKPIPCMLPQPLSSPFSSPAVDMHYKAAVMAAQARRWRESADAYLSAYLEPAVPTGQGGWLIWSAFTCILRESHFKPTEHHLEALRSVAANGPILHRAYAQLTQGLVRFDARDREAAARSYLKCIETASAATAAERAEEVVNSATSPTGESGLAAFKVGELLDDIAAESRDNVEAMRRHDRQQPTDEYDLVNAMADAELRGMDPQRAVHRMTTPIGPLGDRAANEAAARDALSRLGLGGEHCDWCHAAPRADARLKQCGRCQLAYYCSNECSKAAWKAGHKAACRAPGQFEVGDKVLVHGLERSPELNGTIVEVRAPPRASDGRVTTATIGGEKEVAIKPQNLRRLRPAA